MAMHMHTGPFGRWHGPAIHVQKELLFGAWAVIAIVGAAYVLVAISSFDVRLPVAPVAVPETLPAQVVAPPVQIESPEVAPLEAAATMPIVGPGRVAVASTEMVNATLASSVVTRVDISAATVDTQAFILEQAGLAPAAEVAAMVPVAPAASEFAAPSNAFSTLENGRVQTPMAEVDTQEFILAQAGVAPRAATR